MEKMAPLQPSSSIQAHEDASVTEQELITVRRLGDMEGVALVTMNRPDAMNALTKEMMIELARAFRLLREDETVQVAILTGAGRAFCVGVDPNYAEGMIRDVATGMSDVNDDPVAQMELCGFPIIAAINGPAITAGLEIALACDILIASAQARFADTCCKLGVAPGWGLSQKLPRIMGSSRAREFSLTCMMIDGIMAERWGLVSRVVPAAELLDAAKNMAAAIVGNHHKFVMRYKAVLNQGLAMTLCDALKMERQQSRDYSSQLGEEDMATIRSLYDSASFSVISASILSTPSGIAGECQTQPMGQPPNSNETRSLLQPSSTCPSTPSNYQSSPLFGYTYSAAAGYCMNPYLNPYLSLPQATAQLSSPSNNPTALSSLSAPFRTPPSPTIPSSQWLAADVPNVRPKASGTKDASSANLSLRRKIPAVASVVRGAGPIVATATATGAAAATSAGSVATVIGSAAGGTSCVMVVTPGLSTVSGGGDLLPVTSGSVAGGLPTNSEDSSERTDDPAALSEAERMNKAVAAATSVSVFENQAIDEEDLARATNGTAAVIAADHTGGREDDRVVGANGSVAMRDSAGAGEGGALGAGVVGAPDRVVDLVTVAATLSLRACSLVVATTDSVMEECQKEGENLDNMQLVVQGPAQDVGTQTQAGEGEADERDDGQNNSALSRWSRAVDGSRFWWSEERVIMLLEAVRDVNTRLKKRRGMVTSVRKWECVVELTKFPLTATQHENKYNNLKKPYQKYKLQLYRSEMGLIADEEVEDLKKPSYYDVLERYLSDKVKLYPPARKPGSVPRGLTLFNSRPGLVGGKQEKFALEAARPLEMTVAHRLSDVDDEEGGNGHAKQDEIDRVDQEEAGGEVSRETSGNSQEEGAGAAVDCAGGDGGGGGVGAGSSGGDEMRPSKRPRLPLTETIARSISRLIQQREKENVFARQRDLQFSQEIDSLQRELVNALRASNAEGVVVERAREGWAMNGLGIEALGVTREEIEERENALREREKELREREHEIRELQQMARERDDKVRKGLLESSNENLDKMLSLVERM